jgi:penicillin amidase
MRMVRWLKRGAIALLIGIVIAFATGWWLLRGSLATLDGTVALPGLSAPVEVERDALGVVTIHAANETDAMRALGYVHAQERFFEMDLMRRLAAGELAELFGPIAVETDKKHRVHRFRARARQNLDVIAGDKLEQLKAYTDGINAGLADLKVRPWPYLLLGTRPQPWEPADTALVGYAMYFDLQGGTNQREIALWRIKQHVPPALYALISRDGTSWDAPLMGEPRGDATLPDAATLDLRKLPMPKPEDAKDFAESMSPGSNNFAVSGALTRDGRAIVADDMHLGLRAPDIWFRARLLYPDAEAPDGKVDVGGFTLPGIPAVIVGSNTHVAWAFTNSYGDWMDWVQDCLPATDNDCPPANKGEYVFDEKILVKGAAPVVVKVTEQLEGPRMPDVAGAGSKVSLLWTAHKPGGLTLGTMKMANAKDLDGGIKAMNHAGIPAQNMLIADHDGHIAWTIAGRVPYNSFSGTIRPMICFIIRPLPPPPEPVFTPSHLYSPSSGGSTTVTKLSRTPERYSRIGLVKDPHSLTENAIKPVYKCAWRYLPLWKETNPSVRNPATNRLWTANNRVTDGDALKIIGDSGYANGARAKQIRDDLFTKSRFTEKDLLAIQLDDRALFLQRWWQLLRDESARAKTPTLRELTTASTKWDGRADPDSVSYRLVRAWRLQVLSRIRDGLLAPAEAALGKDFIMPDLPQLEGVAWPMVMQRPDNLLSPLFANWDALFEDAAKQVHDDLSKHGALAQRRWGERNTASICHPLARALPSLFKRWLCMPSDELPGDANMPRVASPDFGASERMVVSPGHEADGIIEMPGGQSGHPLSPFWGAGHEAWVRGEPAPFLPGQTTHTLQLVPQR